MSKMLEQKIKITINLFVYKEKAVVQLLQCLIAWGYPLDE